MSKNYELGCVHISARLREAMQSLERSNLQIALVTDDDGKLIGTMTDGDIRRALLNGHAMDSPLATHICRDFVSVGPQAGRAEVVEWMQARTIAQVPIVDEQGRLCGLHLLSQLLGAVERPNWAVIMVGGRGTRLGSLTESVPKPMLRVAGRPILERLVLHLVGHGIRRIFLAVNYLAAVIENHFGDGRHHGCRIEYIREATPLGTGGALSLLPARPAVPLLVLNGDLVSQFDVSALLGFHETKEHQLTIGIHEYAHTVPLGVVDIDGGCVRGIREKPTFTWHANAGIYVVQPELIARVPADTEFMLPDLIEGCLQRGESVGAFSVDGDWIDVGRRDELGRARGQGER
jgi:dTDP-glucose pyrophosphorylase/CBS domain-containing protein